MMRGYKHTDCHTSGGIRNGGSAFLKDPDRAIKAVVLIAFIERIVMFFILGSGATNNSDDVAYIRSGIEFARTGTVSIWSAFPTAMIMPGMPVLTGLFSKLFGEGNAYIDAVRLCWILFGCATVYVFYKCCCFFTGKRIALIASCSFLLLNWAWSDNSVLTEPPYLFFYMLCFYFMLAMGEPCSDTAGRKNAVGFALSFLAALMFRANIVTVPFFCAFYLLVIKKKKARELLFALLALVTALLVFVVPWSIRNYKLFGEFIPISSGSANPFLLGTYQGKNAPEDGELDYEKNVYAPVREKYPEYYNADGTLKDGVIPETVNEKTDRLKAEYRLREWWKKDKLDLIYSYLIAKPACMLNWVWFWIPNKPVYLSLHYISIVNLAMCVLTLAAALFTAKKRGIVLFLSGMYLFNLYTFAFSFASERYAAMSVPLRYFIAAVGLEIAAELIASRRKNPAP